MAGVDAAQGASIARLRVDELLNNRPKQSPRTMLALQPECANPIGVMV